MVILLPSTTIVSVGGWILVRPFGTMQTETANKRIVSYNLKKRRFKQRTWQILFQNLMLFRIIQGILLMFCSNRDSMNETISVITNF